MFPNKCLSGCFNCGCKLFSDVAEFKKTGKKRQIDWLNAYCRKILHKKQKTSTSNTEKFASIFFVYYFIINHDISFSWWKCFTFCPDGVVHILLSSAEVVKTVRWTFTLFQSDGYLSQWISYHIFLWFIILKNNN